MERISNVISEISTPIVKIALTKKGRNCACYLSLLLIVSISVIFALALFYYSRLSSTFIDNNPNGALIGLFDRDFDHVSLVEASNSPKIFTIHGRGITTVSPDFCKIQVGFMQACSHNTLVIGNYSNGYINSYTTDGLLSYSVLTPFPETPPLNYCPSDLAAVTAFYNWEKHACQFDLKDDLQCVNASNYTYHLNTDQIRIEFSNATGAAEDDFLHGLWLGACNEALSTTFYFHTSTRSILDVLSLSLSVAASAWSITCFLAALIVGVYAANRRNSLPLGSELSPATKHPDLSKELEELRKHGDELRRQSEDLKGRLEQLESKLLKSV